MVEDRNSDAIPSPRTLRQLAWPFLKVGTLGFGGGLGMVALLRSEVVQRRRWLSDDELTTGLALGQLLPGPFISNYCWYIGHHLKGWRGAVVAGGSMILPSFLFVTILSALYFEFHTIPVVTHIFRGIGPVITAVIMWAAIDMRKAMLRGYQGLIAFVFAFGLFVMRVDPVVTVIATGILGLILRRARRGPALWALPLLVFHPRKAIELFCVFLKTGAVVFGGGYAAIPFIGNEVSIVRDWLSRQEFIDGVALGQITPGPVAITATFVGFKVMGIPGALIATVAIFLPSLLMLLVLVRIYRRIEHNPDVTAFFDGLKAAVVAILLSTGLFFCLEYCANLAFGILTALCLALLVFLRIPPLYLIPLGAIAGFLFG